MRVAHEAVFFFGHLVLEMFAATSLPLTPKARQSKELWMSEWVLSPCAPLRNNPRLVPIWLRAVQEAKKFGVL